MRSPLRSGLTLAAAAALGATLAVAPAAAPGNGNGNGLGGRPTTAQSVYTDEISDYGVCRGVDPSCYNDWGQGWEEGEDKSVLIWSRTAGPRHAHLGTPLAPGINPPLNPDNVAQAALVSWLAERGIQADVTEDLNEFRRVNRYNAVIFLSSNRDTMDDTAQTSLKQFVRGGGGFVGIHNAFGAEYSYPWYEGLLGGANFYSHGPHREGTIETTNDADASTEFLPEEWGYKDEWYNLVPYPSYVNVLLEASEETSVNPRDGGHPGHAELGEAHPVSWCHYYDGGRSWLTTLGHDVANFTDAELTGDEFFKQHVIAGVESAMGVQPFCES